MHKSIPATLTKTYSDLSGKAAARCDSNITRFPHVWKLGKQSEFIKTLSRKHNGSECSPAIEIALPIVEEWARKYSKNNLPGPLAQFVTAYQLDHPNNIWTGLFMGLCGRGTSAHSTGKSELKEILGADKASQVAKSGMLGESRSLATAIQAVDSVLQAAEVKTEKAAERKRKAQQRKRNRKAETSQQEVKEPDQPTTETAEMVESKES